MCGETVLVMGHKIPVHLRGVHVLWKIIHKLSLFYLELWPSPPITRPPPPPHGNWYNVWSIDMNANSYNPYQLSMPVHWEKSHSVELCWLEHIWDYENLYETGVVWTNESWLYSQIKKHNMVIFSIFFLIKVCCVYSLKSPHRGNSYEYTQQTVFIRL